MAQSFKVSLTIRKAPNCDPVYFKVDGGRFASEKTLKLNADAEYELELCVKPAHQISSMKIFGGAVTAEQTNKSVDEVQYKAMWNTGGIMVNKSGKRHQIPILVEFSDLGDLSKTLQCKFYPRNEASHTTWGSPCHAVELQCVKPENSSFIDIRTETYR